MPHEFAEPSVAIIKHTNPSGLASAANLLEGYRLAFACDPVSAFGSIIAVNRDPHAPILKMADLGLVGDAKTVLAMVLEKLRKRL